MLDILDIAGESYSAVMAVVNFVCFAALCICITYIYVTWTFGLFIGSYKNAAIVALLVAIVLCVAHYITSTFFNIPLLVPPIGSVYFTAFIHVIQYIVTIAFVILCFAIFIFALASRIVSSYSKSLASAFIAFAVLIVIHYWVSDEFGVPLIFPSTLW